MPQNIIDPRKFNPPNESDNLSGIVSSNIERYRDTHSLKVNQPYIIDLITFEKLHFQTIPEQIDINSESAFAALESPGRNNPLYHFTGAEDIIKFSFTWYANDKSKEDALRQAKWLQSLSRPDGYKASVHPVKLIFGRLFKNSKYIVAEAPFTMRLFDREKGMFPSHIDQNITLRKISLINSERAELLNPEY